MRPYEVILHERAWAALASAGASEKKRLVARLEELRSTPFREGDFQQRGATGRINAVILTDDWLLTFCSDRAAA